MGLRTASTPSVGGILPWPLPLRNTNRAWLKRIVAGSVHVEDLPAPVTDV